MSTSNLITIAVFVCGLGLSAFVAYFGFVRNISTRVTIVEQRCFTHQAVIDSIATLNSRVDKVANDNEVFWKVIGPHLEDIIHSPKSVDRDALVAKLTGDTIEKQELPVLIEMLHEAIAKPEWNNEKKFAGVLLLARATALLNDERYERRRT
jgi:hypothetical protein